VFESIEKRGDEFVKTIQKFEAVFEDGTNYTADILLESGKRLECKSLKKNTFGRLMKGDQFKNQLKNYIHNGDFEYIIDRNKLLKDGLLDPDKFVKGEFQKVFKENASTWFKAIENGGNLLDKSQLRKLFGTDNINQIKNIIDDIDNIFYKTTIKIE
jgi:hypothetical protein